MYSEAFYESIYQEIRQKICSLEFSPGSGIPLEELSNDLEISKASIRKALVRLSNDELIVIKPSIGYFATKIEPEKINTSAFIKNSIGKSIIIDFHHRIKDEAMNASLTDMKTTISNMIEAIQSNNMQLLNDIDNLFHAQLGQLSNFPRVISLFAKEQPHLTRVFRLSIKNVNDYATLLKCNQEILEGLIKSSLNQALEALNGYHEAFCDLIKKAQKDYPNYFIRRDYAY